MQLMNEESIKSCLSLKMRKLSQAMSTSSHSPIFSKWSRGNLRLTLPSFSVLLTITNCIAMTRVAFANSLHSIARTQSSLSLRKRGHIKVSSTMGFDLYLRRNMKGTSKIWYIWVLDSKAILIRLKIPIPTLEVIGSRCPVKLKSKD